MKITEHTQKWLDALRSGEYRQTQYVLKDEQGYCCLGVAAELMGIPCESDEYELLKKNLGMNTEEQCHVIKLNDGEKKTFLQIADAIEKMLDVS